MNVSYVVGDMIEAIDKFKNPDTLHVAHGANCFHTMGAGVAKALVKRFGVNLVMTDQYTSYGDINKLGTSSRYISPKGVRVYNCYTQHDIKRSADGTFVHWHSVGNALLEIIFEGMEEGDTLFIPKIGCGLAGGSDEDFKRMLTSVCHSARLHKCHYDLVVFSL